MLVAISMHFIFAGCCLRVVGLLVVISFDVVVEVVVVELVVDVELVNRTFCVAGSVSVEYRCDSNA